MGNRNLGVGFQAGYNAVGSGNIFLGYRAGYNETGNDKLYIHNDNTSNPLIYGEFDNELLRINGKLEINEPEDAQDAATKAYVDLLSTETQTLSSVVALGNTANSQLKDVTDPTDAQDAATKAYVDGEISSLPTITTYAIGDFAQGGIVFWVDETGQHGLVCAKSDQSGGIRWWAGIYGNTQAKGDGPYSGEANTVIIISSQVAIGDDGYFYEARICNELQITEAGTTFGDWYLPSKYELILMYQNKATIDVTALANGGSGFSSAYYWSSTEFTSDLAWRQNFSNGYLDYNGIKYYLGIVRAVRAF